VLHAAIGIAMRKVPAVATAHALLVLLAVVAVSLFARRSYYVLLAAAYIAGSEVLWRMSKAGVFYETGKYLFSLVLLVAIVRMKRPRIPGLAALYLVLLVPSIVTAYFTFPWGWFRQMVSFNLSGPLSLAVAVCFAHNVKMSRQELLNCMLAFLVPACGVVAITLFTTYSAEALKFSMESNFLTSGGFGPNQVSAVLGFAVLIAFLYVVSAKVSILTKLFLVGAAAVFAAQSAMTFSRAGLASAAIALMVSLPFLITDRRRRIWTVAGIVALALAGFVLFPVLNSYTGGKLQKRFEETSLSNREALAAQDLDLFQQNPLYGVGVGLSVFLRPTRAAAHTEFTRLLADHGLLGATALLALVLQLGQTLLTSRTHWVLGLRAAAVSWTLLNFAINAMRLVAPSYALCVAFVNLEESTDHGTPVSSHVGQG
jgi:hypothetical protein